MPHIRRRRPEPASHWFRTKLLLTDWSNISAPLKRLRDFSAFQPRAKGAV